MKILLEICAAEFVFRSLILKWTKLKVELHAE